MNPDSNQILPTSEAAYVLTDVVGATPKYAQLAYGVRFDWTAAEAVIADIDAVHAAITDTGLAVTTVTGITNPPCARNITATTDGTAGDIKAVQAVIVGTDINDAVITETLPIFTVNTKTTVVGAKAFKTVTSITIPAQDGTGATVSIGYGDILGLPIKMSRNTLLKTYLADTLEGTAATVATSATVLASNTIDLNSALDGTAVKAYFMLP